MHKTNWQDKNLNILLIDDEKQCLETITTVLNAAGFTVKSFISPVEALKVYKPRIFDMVVTDYHLTEITGLELIRIIHQKEPLIPIIVISGDLDEAVKINSLKLGAHSFFNKPLDIRELISGIKAISRNE